jgi:uncharacterized membrane protein
MSNSLIFVWAIAVYGLAVFVAAYAVLRTRSENQQLRARVQKLEAMLRSREPGRAGDIAEEEVTRAGGVTSDGDADRFHE